MSRHNEIMLGGAIKAYIKELNLKPKLDQTRLTQCWEEYVGKTIARHTTKLYMKEGVLYLYLSSAPLKQELLYSKDKLAKLLNEKLGGEVIADVVIR